ncbi:hypothetical protein [Azospirillum endophyticum]
MKAVRQSQYPLGDAVPQAIFWRRIAYFTESFREEEDDLDSYKAATFLIGNEIRFELRTYAGNNPNTATVFFHISVNELNAITDHLDTVIGALNVPDTAIAWRRGQNFEYGRLDRPEGDRLREAEARILALKIAATCPNRTISTEALKARVPKVYELSPIDLKPSRSRSGEQKWEQIVGNVISHQEVKVGPFVRGFAERTNDGLTVTNRGVDYLKRLGFSV